MLTILGIVVFALCVASAAVTGTFERAPFAEAAKLSAGQWREDLRFMTEEMEQRHTNLFNAVSREAFFAAGAECSAPKKLDRFGLEFPVFWNLAGRRQKDAGIEVHGRAEGVHYQAGRVWDSGGGDLPQGRDRPGDVF